MARKNKPVSPPRKNGKQGAKSQKSNTTIISFKESDIAQRWLITTDGCPTCEEIKSDFKKEFKSGKIKSTDVGDDKGFEIITALGINEVPIFIIELKPGHPSGILYIVDE